MDNDCVTPTMKLKRNVLAKRYVDRLKNVYALGGEPPKEGEKW